MPNAPVFNWDALLFNLSRGQVIPIIGKELVRVSVNGTELPLEQALAAPLAGRLGLSAADLPPDARLNDVAALHAANGGDESVMYQRICMLMSEQQFAVPASLERLASITDFPLYVTLTFDDFLDRAVSKARFGSAPATVFTFRPFSDVEDLPEPAQRLQTPYVFHLFGSVSTLNEYAVTDEDCLEFVHLLQNEKRRPKELFEAFRKNDLLFIGCGFDDWLERFVIRTIRNKRFSEGRQGARELIADLQATSDRNLTIFLQQYKASVFPEGHPEQFVNELHTRWSERNKSTQQAQPGQRMAHADGAEHKRAAYNLLPPGAIFISYSSDDVAAARTMQKALEKAGLEVWIDKAKIPSGSDWRQQIEANIRSCSVFVPLLSTGACERPEGVFWREWRAAIDREQDRAPGIELVLPIIVDDMAPVDAEKSVPGFRGKHIECFRDGRPDERFIGRLRELQKQSRSKSRGR